MPAATWGESDSVRAEAYPLSILKNLIYQMMTRFSAHGACVALYDETLGQMVVKLHVRLRAAVAAAQNSAGTSTEKLRVGRHTTINLQDPASSAVGRLRRTMGPQDELEDVSPQESALFPVGTAYPADHDLIGYTWRENRICIMRHGDYLQAFHNKRKTPLKIDIKPCCYFATPIREVVLAPEEAHETPPALGVVVLYQFAEEPGFHLQQRQEAQAFTERMALYLQNHHLRQAQRRSSDHLRWLQQLSAIFPTTVNLANLLEQVYQFTARIVDLSAMLVTLYDRDTKMIYDVYAVRDGKPVEGLPAQSVEPRERRQWWRVTQEEKRTLLLDPAHLEPGTYDELLQGVWGDQRGAGTFLLLPMKMFNRVIGSLCIASAQQDAYSHEEIQVLETMVQIITVGIENARLYERSRRLLRKARQREESLAAMNSALQSISSVLNVGEMLDNFVKAVANLVQAEMCIFFQLSDDGTELDAQALYAPRSKGQSNEAFQESFLFSSEDRDKHAELIEMIHLPFKGSFLEQMVDGGTFFYLDAQMAEELAQESSEGGAIFLRETGIEKMIMIPIRYQNELMGVLAIHTPRQSRVFKPEEVGMLLAIGGQAASAIRNAQLFEQIQEANAELQRMNTLKDEFIVTASHELRTPLSAISGYASLLKRQSARATPQQVMRFASKIAASAQQLSALVANMTEAANMDALGRKLDLHLDAVELRTAVEMIVSMVAINIEQKITVDVPADLWLNCDAQLLRQVLTNLLDNAAKYSSQESRIEIRAQEMKLAEVPLPEDQIDHRVLLEQGSELPVVLVSVRDEGEGILPEEQAKIFEKFVRASRSLTTPVRGSGLGLYICRRFVEAMGGKLWLAESIPGEGSVFSFYLPRTSAPPEASEQDEVEADDADKS